MKIIVDGVNGLLGSDIYEVLKRNYDVIPIYGQKDVDLTDYKAVKQFVQKNKPDIFIHCAGLKDVDVAQKDPLTTYNINTLATRNIAVTTAAIKSKMVHISSAAVFDGSLDRPYCEFDITNPVNIYGHSKYLAENEVKIYNNHSFIIRVPLLFGHNGRKETNPIYKMKKRLENGESDLLYTTDQISNPTYTVDVAKAIEIIMITDAYGTYNVGNSGEASRYDYFKYIAEKMGFDGTRIKPTLMGVKFAPREKKVVLDTSLIKKAFSIEMRSWQDAMEECLNYFE